MKKWKPSTKTKQALSVTFMVLSVAFFILLFVFKDKLNSYVSKAIQDQANAEIKNTETFYIDSAFNYTRNGEIYEITFLEFGSKGCSACKRMEKVMREIQLKYPNQIKVVFINIQFPENQDLMKFFGIAVIPTQVLLNKEGKEFFRHTGYYSSDEIIKNLTLN